MDCDVVIIGGGPVGVSALAGLGQAGVSAICIDRESSVWTQARAVHFDGETMRSLQTLGVADEAMAICNPMESLRMENEARETLFSYPTGILGPQGWHEDVMFHQPDMEHLVRDKAISYAGTELRPGTTLTSFEQADGVVRSTVRDADGRTYVLTSRWLIAADGATSTVRRLAGIETEKLGKDDPWLVVDGLLERDGDTYPIDGDMVFLGHHSRPALWVRLPGNRVRMEFKVMPDDDPTEIVTPRALERISHGALPESRFTPDRIAIYTFRARVATRWRVGNVFLAGDAAHQAPPLFGQGLCAGMRDIANLAWKIGLVADGTASPDLLDTYESERKPHAHYWVSQAATMAEILQTIDPNVAAHRDAHIRENPLASAPPPPPSLGPGLHIGDRDARAGVLAPQPWLGDDRRLDDEVGPRFLVAAPTSMLEALPSSIRRALSEDPRTAVVTDPMAVTALAGTEGAAAVLRPDRYVLGIADTADDLSSIVTMIPSVRLTLDDSTLPTPHS
ncbi:MULTISPECIES: bifunctional 3-(3-hydroxy-phenyl)propionate/3-hydroxycinnamic acid hydroxylase [unclassified Rhodococcus (in: high G+C Gram-positive bacteria)]|uniref:bifunctional 3-(3-hydroxy-phenyl)propionate/3-hydroxycinnamic acid hydroxylase n=1 Tax=unclassified Rhodococcus (in: high G+C Gram-positive bacteria) TaxID=192944 RepID=UPI000A3F7067|nr:MULTISPECIES: bifunctional 3-(3-hydroxy-phenyl)propionate/3-hydroxycinnamic acid hydroxylase [unclassified Rhodococcus (in: high G+C Gram-positive bacteria)]